MRRKKHSTMHRCAVALGRGVVCFCAWALVAPPLASAQTAEVKAVAERKASEAKRLAAAGQHDRALEAFKEAYASYQDPGYLYDIGIECQALGRDVEAFQAFDHFLQDAQKIPPEFIADANQQRREIKKRIGEVEVRSTQEGCRVAIDGVDRGVVTATLLVPPGKHTVRVTKEGFEPIEVVADVPPGAATRVDALMRPVPVGPPPPVPVVSSGFAPEPPPPPPPPPDTTRDHASAVPLVHLGATGGAGFWATGVPQNPSPSAIVNVFGGARVVSFGEGRAELRLGLKAGLTLISEPSSTDWFVSLLADPIVTVEMASHFYGFAEVGLGMLILAGLQPTSVMIKPGATQVTTLSTFELRPSLGLAYAITPALRVFVAPALAWSPAPDPHFVDSSIVRVELGAGLAVYL
jgi:PEGA domain